MTALLFDLRYAIRGLAARPLFALVAIASLTLGIGVNTAIFSLFQQVALQPLPVHAPERLVNFSAPGIRAGSISSGSMGGPDAIFSYPMLRDLEQQLPVQFLGLAGHKGMSAVLRWGETTRSAGALLVSAGYFDVLGLQPALGRLIGDREQVDGANRVAVLANHFWRNRLAADLAVIGKPITVNGETLTVIGVAPPGFSGTSFGNPVDLFIPLTLHRLDPRSNDDVEQRNSYWIYLFGRLAPDATIEQAEQAINLPFGRIINEVEMPLQSSLDESRRAEFASTRIQLAPGTRGQSVAASEAIRPLALLFGVAALVLLIACLNIANLLLARGTTRAAEFAIRASIGGRRRRLLRQSLLEALLLAAAGGLASLPLAALTLATMIEWMPSDALGAIEPVLSRPALLFAGAAAALTSLLFGLFPALQLAGTAPTAILRGGSGQSVSRSGNRFRTVFATTQIGLSMASLVLAGLFAMSLSNIANEDIGMEVDSLATFTISPIRHGYDSERAETLFDRVEQELAALSGVTEVASSSVPLLSQYQVRTNVGVEGFEPASEPIYPAYSQIGANFFRTMGMRLLAGRDFTPADNRGAGKVAIVNRRFAEYYGIGPNPVGKRMAVGTADLDIEIVGLVEDSKYHDIRTDSGPVFFVPRRQWVADEMSFYLRTGLAPEAILPNVRERIAALDRDLEIDELASVRQRIAGTIAIERFVGVLSGAFALLATLLTALGLYGVLSYTLSQRTREFGLRLALGAQPRRLARMILRQVGRITIVGGLLGLVAAVLLGRAAQSLLFGLEGHDPRVLAAAAALLALVALASSWLPARRAGRIDPMVALRHD